MAVPPENSLLVLISAPDPLKSSSAIVATHPRNFKHSNKDGGGEQQNMARLSDMPSATGLGRAGLLGHVAKHFLEFGQHVVEMALQWRHFLWEFHPE